MAKIVNLPHKILADVNDSWDRKQALLYRAELEDLRAKRRNRAALMILGWSVAVWSLALNTYLIWGRK